MPAAPIITLTTDFGLRDGYVAALKGVLLSRVPQVRLVDLGHRIHPADVVAASRLLSRAVPYFPSAAIHVAVVDPGVGSSRAVLVLEHPAGRFVAADNGLLTPWLDDGKTVALDRPDLYLQSPGNTFHGRDRMAPAAAALASGVPVSELGPPVRDPVRLPEPVLERSEGLVRGAVTHIDRFGNIITNIPWSWIEALPDKACAWVSGRPICRRVSHYAELPAGVPGFLCGSEGTLELACNQTPLADEWQLEIGAGVEIRVGTRPDEMR